MDVLNYVLEGLEQWLEVERECGVRALEVERSLLLPPTGQKAEPTASRDLAATSLPGATSSAGESGASGPTADSSTLLDFVFLHDSPLSPAGIEMMAKIVNAMGRTAETAPVVIAPPLPRARIYIVLGARALKKYFPGTKGEPGKWVKSAAGADILVTYSPAFILRFPTVTDAVMKMKREMWTSLKGVMQKLNGGKDGR